MGTFHSRDGKIGEEKSPAWLTDSSDMGDFCVGSDVLSLFSPVIGIHLLVAADLFIDFGEIVGQDSIEAWIVRL